MIFDLDSLPFSLRKMTLDDLPSVLAIEQKAYPVPWPEATYRHELRFNPRAWFDVVTYQENIIGYSGMWQFVEEVHLGTIVSHHAVRGRGIGELLLINIIHRTQTLPTTELVTLEVRSSNEPAQRLYTKYGFKEVGRRTRYYKDGEDALIMTTPPVDTIEYAARVNPLVEKLLENLRHFSLDLSLLRVQE